MPVKRTVYAVDTTVKRSINSGSRGYFFAGWCYPVPEKIDDYYVLDQKLCEQISNGNLYTNKPILMEHNQMAPIGKILECKYDRKHGPKGALYLKAWIDEGFFKSAEEIKAYKLSISYGVDRRTSARNNKSEDVRVTPLEISLTKNPEFPTEIVIVHSNSVTMSEASGDSQPAQDVPVAAPTEATPSQAPSEQAVQRAIDFCALEEIMTHKPADMMEFMSKNQKNLEEMIRSAAQTSREYNAAKEANEKLVKDLEEAKKFQTEATRAEIKRSTEETLGPHLPPEKIDQVVEFFTKHPEHSGLSEIFAHLAQKKSQVQKPRDISALMEDFERTRRSQDTSSQLVAAFGNSSVDTRKPAKVSHSLAGKKRAPEPSDSYMSIPYKLYRLPGDEDISPAPTRFGDELFSRASATIEEILG